MKWYFENITRQQELKRILSSWKGTPYRHGCGVKGAGADCTYFLLRVLEELGFGPFKIPSYPRDWNLHNADEELLKGFLKYLPCKEVKIEDPMNGDIILFFFGKMCSHAGFYFGDLIHHCVNRSGVIETAWAGDPMWTKRKRYMMRLTG